MRIKLNLLLAKVNSDLNATLSSLKGLIKENYENEKDVC